MNINEKKAAAFLHMACGEMKPLRVMSIHKSVRVTSFYDVLTEARGNIYADSTLISYVIWSPLSSVLCDLISDYTHFFCVFKFSLKIISDYFLNFK